MTEMPGSSLDGRFTTCPGDSLEMNHMVQCLLPARVPILPPFTQDLTPHIQSLGGSVCQPCSGSKPCCPGGVPRSLSAHWMGLTPEVSFLWAPCASGKL